MGTETVERAQQQRDAAAARLKKASRGRRGADRKERTDAKRRGRRRRTGAAQVARLRAHRDQRRHRDARKTGRAARDPERESLRGSAYKRLALIAAVAGQPAEERRAIETAKRHYARATTIGLESQASNVFYPGLNYLAADLAVNAGRRGWKGVDRAIVEATKKSLDDKAAADPDFWSIVGQAELQLYGALAEGRKLATVRESLERKYNDLHERVDASWLWASAYDTAGFVLRRYAARATPSEAKAAACAARETGGFARGE
jgi:hypothetical protein